jgi:Na+-driven multidrug efflux pump
MSLIRECRQTLKLAFPLVIGQVSQMLLGVADTVMIGKLGVTELAVLTFANSLFYVPFIFGLGVLTAISVFTSTRELQVGSLYFRHTRTAAFRCHVVVFVESRDLRAA